MKEKYLDLHYRWLKRGQIEHRKNGLNPNGLCCYFGEYKFPNGLFSSMQFSVLDEHKDFELFMPSAEQQKLSNLTEGGYWGAPNTWIHERAGGYTSLRQNIVLLMAAMNDEL